MNMNNSMFSPLTLGKISLANRICFLAHRTNFGRLGRLNDRHIAYYRRRAQGGCGLIVLGELSIHAGDQPWESMIHIYHASIVTDLQKLTSAVKPYGTRIFAQLNHHGFQSSGAISRQVTWGPSAMADIVFGEPCKVMEIEDMKVVGEAFAGAAILAREGGMDGLEIDMGPESLLRQFLSPISNHRQDEYGGDCIQRMHFPLMIIDKVRKAVGNDFTVGVRLSVDEQFWGGISLDDSCRVVKKLAADKNIDFLNVDIGTYYNIYLSEPSMLIESGQAVQAATEIKKQVDLPVMAKYQIDNPEALLAIMGSPKTDLIGLVRPLICDPDLPKKAERGEDSDIRYCIRDNQGCIGRVNQSKSIGCTLNAAVGRELLAGDDPASPVKKSAKVKKIIVVGGGPAGLEAARVAALRGHLVTLYEKSETIGGQVNLITKRPGRENMAEINRYFSHALAGAGVEIKTGSELNEEQILAEKPDAVIVATGSRPKTAPFSGKYGPGPPGVLNSRQLLSGRYPVGKKVLYIDESGGRQGASTVEFLADQGKKIEMVTSDPFIGVELAPIGELNLMRQRLLQKGVVFIQEVQVEEINPDKVTAREIYSNRIITFEGHDTVVVDAGNVARDSLYQQLKGKVPELYRVGDAVAPRSIEMAILEGKAVGERV
jgi:mycofactocin system FadH/OYE family oxidoreductase 2